MMEEQTLDGLRPGSLVGPWRVEGYAGRGTYGAVYQAWRAPPGTDPESRMDPVRAPLLPRESPRELNPRVLTELSALIERMLAAEPEARGLAREVAEAAEAAAEHAGPEADVPLMGSTQVRVGAVVEPVHVQVPANIAPPVSEPVPVEAGGVRVQQRAEPDVPLAGVEQAPAGMRSAPVPGRAGVEGERWRMRARLVVVAGLPLTAMAAIWWMGHGPYAHTPTRIQEEELEPEWAKSDGEAALADASVPTRVLAQEPTRSEAPIALEMPDGPLPGQRRPPCRPREVTIRGGCWVRLGDFSPPCDDESYAWQGACYLPKLERARPPTSKDPQK